MVKSVFFLLALVLCTQKNHIRPDEMVGSYYVAAYSKSDFEGKIILKKDFPIQSDTIYIPENDVDKIVEFHPDGNLIFYELPNSYFCGDLQRIGRGEGTWKRVNKKEIEILWKGKSAIEEFEIKLKYQIESHINGDKILSPVF